MLSSLNKYKFEKIVKYEYASLAKVHENNKISYANIYIYIIGFSSNFKWLPMDVLSILYLY